MKPEPLKNKIISYVQMDSWDEGGKYSKGFRLEDVCFAVNLLKEKIIEDNKILSKDYELKLFGPETNHFIDLFFKNTLQHIDEVFEDVMKND